MIQFFIGLVVGVSATMAWAYYKTKSTKKEWWQEGLPPPEYDPNSEE